LLYSALATACCDNVTIIIYLINNNNNNNNNINFSHAAQDHREFATQRSDRVPIVYSGSIKSER